MARVYRSSRNSIRTLSHDVYLIQIQAVPGPKALDAEGMAGAYINCWVNFALEEGAEVLARHYVEDAGWVITEVEGISWVEREDYEGHESLPYFDEASQDGVSIVLHMYPAEEAREPDN